MLSCFGSRRRREDQEALLPQYDDDTSLQRQLHQKLHTYQMLRALSKGFMPSTEQTIVNLRTLLAADVLNPENVELSQSGRALVHYSRQFIHQLIDLVRHKNDKDQIQDLVWYLSKASVSLDVQHVLERAAKAKQKADTAAAYSSLKTVGSLLLTNSDFRLFLADLNAVGREVFRDAAFSLSDVSREAGERLQAPESTQKALREPGHDDGVASSQQDLQKQAAEVAEVMQEGVARVAKVTEHSIASKLQGDEKDTLIYRLRQAVVKLRRRPDYKDSVSTLSLLLRRYATVYSHAAHEAIQTVEEGVDRNAATDRAVRNFWLVIKSFGDSQEWDELESQFGRVMEHGRTDADFDQLIRQLGKAVQDMLTDPAFFDHAEERFHKLRAQSSKLASASSLRDDTDQLLAKLHSTVQSVLRDKDVADLIDTSTTIAKILSPAHQYINSELVTDGINVFVPLVMRSIQYIPIPRLEVLTPQVDLLLENLILEPGVTVNDSSFLPYKLRVETYNDLEIRKARFRTTSAVKSLVRIKMDGLSVRADEVGFVLRARPGFFRFADEGIASFRLDERGMDIHLDVEIGQDGIEKMVSLHAVRVHIHKLDYTLRRSSFSLLAWLFKPLVRPLVRKAIEMQMASAVAEALHFTNRELTFARERLRATRIADPDDVRTFVRAVLARLVPAEDPDLVTRLGVDEAGEGPFRNVYAPGSVVKLWHEEAVEAAQRLREAEEDGWRSQVFDVHATMLA